MHQFGRKFVGRDDPINQILAYALWVILQEELA